MSSALTEIDDLKFMTRALELARRGYGRAAPNPMVGCVIVKDGSVVGEGWHVACGEAHAEAAALMDAGPEASGATVYVTLEPCAHQGRTPPCTDALVSAGVSRVVIAAGDPFKEVAGKGITILQTAGIAVETGLCESESRALNRAYYKRIESGLPWVIAKWAMTLDGRIATSTGDSKWISNPQARAAVHEIRGVVDAVLVGIGTAVADDPLLTARPETGTPPRQPVRIVVDSSLRLSADCQLVRTAAEFPLLVCCGPDADASNLNLLQRSGAEILQFDSSDRNERVSQLLQQLAARDMTRVLVEGGGTLIGALHDLNQIDEVHAFIGPKLIGGIEAVAPVMGIGHRLIADGTSLDVQQIQALGDNVHVHALVRKSREQ